MAEPILATQAAPATEEKGGARIHLGPDIILQAVLANRGLVPLSMLFLILLPRVGWLEASKEAVASLQKSEVCKQGAEERKAELKKSLEGESVGPAEWVETRDVGGSGLPRKCTLQTLFLCFCFVLFFCQRD